MITETTTLPDGTVQLRVCQDNLCAVGWVSSHHLIEPKELQLRQQIRRAAYNAFIENAATK
jgi:hypothetical protein